MPATLAPPLVSVHSGEHHALPGFEPAALHPLLELEGRSWRLACLVRDSSPRRDVQTIRAEILCLLLAMRCPEQAHPARPWYVRGAVARMGKSGLRRAWRGETPPSERTIATHLRRLEDMGAIARSPGDWHPARRGPNGEIPRWPDTIHVLLAEADAEWWMRVGHQRVEENPECRHNPHRWRQLFDRWREEARAPVQGHLFPAEPRPSAPTRARRELERAKDLPQQLARAARDTQDQLAVLRVLRAAGDPAAGRNSAVLAQGDGRTRGAAALLARALLRGDRVRSLAGWLWTARRRAGRDELLGAMAWARSVG